MKLAAALVLLLEIAALSAEEECGTADLKKYIFGNCNEVEKRDRVIYLKSCINEYDHRNYTVAWAGERVISCIRLTTNGKVFIMGGGVEEAYAIIYIESTQGEELDYTSDIYVKKIV